MKATFIAVITGALVLLGASGGAVREPAGDKNRDAIYWPIVDKDASHQITIGPNVLVSKDNQDAMHAELYLDTDPTNANRLIACGFATTTEASMFEQSGQWDVVYNSDDGGASWHLTRRSNTLASDPGCTFDKAGRAYFLASQMTRRDGLVVYHSDDNGKHWSLPRTAGFVDNVTLTSDPFMPGRFGRLYIAGQDGPLTYSDDGGATFKTRKMPSSKIEWWDMGRGAVFTDGTLILPRLKTRTTTNGMWPYPLYGKPSGWVQDWIIPPSLATVAKFTVDSVYHPISLYGNYAAVAPMSVDTVTKQFHNSVYALFTDSRVGRGRLLFTRSTDRGKTWSSPTIMDDDVTVPIYYGKGPEDFRPMIAVNKDGVIGVAWADRRDNPDGLGWWVRFRSSLDGGATWTPSVRVSSAPNAYDSSHIDPRNLSLSAWPSGKDGLASGTVVLGFHLDAFDMGDYTNMAADTAGNFHPIWIDDRTGVPNMWTASIHVSGSVMRHPFPTTASLRKELPAKRMQTCADDYGNSSSCGRKSKKIAPVANQITTRLGLTLSGLRYNPRTQVFSMWARFQNLSDKPLKGPFALVLAELLSGIGQVQAINSENGKTGAGAAWHLLQDAAPHDYTDAAYLQFRLTHIRPFRRGVGAISRDGSVLTPAELVSFRARLVRE